MNEPSYCVYRAFCSIVLPTGNEVIPAHFNTISVACKSFLFANLSLDRTFELCLGLIYLLIITLLGQSLHP